MVPPFDEKVPLEPDFFQLVPQINMLLHRIEFMYEEYKVLGIKVRNKIVIGLLTLSNLIKLNKI